MDTQTTIILINIAVIGLIACIIVKLYYREEESKDNNQINYNKKSFLDKAGLAVRNVFNRSGNNKQTNEDLQAFLNNHSNNTYMPSAQKSEVKTWEEPREVPDGQTQIASKVFQEPIENKHKEVMNQLNNQRPEFTKIEGKTPIETNLKSENRINEDVNVPLKNRVIENKILNNKKETPEEDLFSIKELVEKSKEKDDIKNFDEDDGIIIVEHEKENELNLTEENPLEDESPKIKDIVAEENVIIPEKEHSNEESLHHLEVPSNENLEDFTKKDSLLNNDDEFGKSLDKTDMFDENDFELVDFGEIKNSIKNSKIVKNVKKFAEDKLIETKKESPDDEFIRNVRTYDIDEEPTYVKDKILGQNAKKQPVQKQNTIEVNINNNKEILKKGDTVIFNYGGESYSSKIIDIYGNDVEVRYRRENVLIHPEDIKKIF